MSSKALLGFYFVLFHFVFETRFRYIISAWLQTQAPASALKNIERKDMYLHAAQISRVASDVTLRDEGFRKCLGDEGSAFIMKALKRQICWLSS